MTGCVEITVYLSETFFITPLKENIVFVKQVETSFGSSILAAFTWFQSQGTDTFYSTWG